MKPINLSLLSFTLLALFPYFASASVSTPSEISHESRTVQSRILKHYHHWEGVRYKFGGTGKTGIDCSAFIQKIFMNFDFHLPRTTQEQIKLGKYVTKNELKSGDLIFFRTSKMSRHVGIYIENQEFIHASTSAGVTISSLNNTFWAQRYEQSKRVL